MKNNHRRYKQFLKRQKQKGLVNKCMAIEIIEDESKIAILAKKEERQSLYRKPGFSIILVKTSVYNERTGEEYASLAQLQSGWPRTSSNFRTMFVARGGSCDKQQALSRERISGSSIANFYYVDLKQLKKEF